MAISDADFERVLKIARSAAKEAPYSSTVQVAIIQMITEVLTSLQGVGVSILASQIALAESIKGVGASADNPVGELRSAADAMAESHGLFAKAADRLHQIALVLASAEQPDGEAPIRD